MQDHAFKKVYYDDLLGRAVSKFVPADDLIVPYTATSLDDAESIIHRIKNFWKRFKKTTSLWISIEI